MRPMHTRRTGRALTIVAACAALLAPLLAPGAAQAYWRGGVFIGVPFFYPPPPVYVPPPVYYAPPPVYYPPPPVAYAPPPAFQPGPGRTCFAGGYTCPLGGDFPPGASCSCPTGRGSAYGRAG